MMVFMRHFLFFALLWVLGCSVVPEKNIGDNIAAPRIIKKLNDRSFLVLNSSAFHDYRNGSLQVYEWKNDYSSYQLVQSYPVDKYGTGLALSSDRKYIAVGYFHAKNSRISLYGLNSQTQRIESFLDEIVLDSSYYVEDMLFFSFSGKNYIFARLKKVGLDDTESVSYHASGIILEVKDGKFLSPSLFSFNNKVLSFHENVVILENSGLLIFFPTLNYLDSPSLVQEFFQKQKFDDVKNIHNASAIAIKIDSFINFLSQKNNFDSFTNYVTVPLLWTKNKALKVRKKEDLHENDPLMFWHNFPIASIGCDRKTIYLSSKHNNSGIYSVSGFEKIADGFSQSFFDGIDVEPRLIFENNSDVSNKELIKLYSFSSNNQCEILGLVHNKQVRENIEGLESSWLLVSKRSNDILLKELPLKGVIDFEKFNKKLSFVSYGLSSIQVFSVE